MRLGPPGYPTFAVVSVARSEHLVLLAGGDEGGRNSWSFVLRPRGDGGSRLIVRSRYAFPATPGQWVMWRAITEPLHFVMERRMLLGIKARAQRAALT